MNYEKLWDRTEENRLRAEAERLREGIRAVVAMCPDCTSRDEAISVLVKLLGGEDVRGRKPCDSCVLESTRRQLAAARAVASKLAYGPMRAYLPQLRHVELVPSWDTWTELCALAGECGR